MTELRNAIEEASKEHYENSTTKVRLRQSEFCPSTRQSPGELSVLSFNYCFVSSVLESSTAGQTAGRIGRVSLSLNAGLDAVL